MEEMLCQAIAGRRLLRLYYTSGAPGYRTVEPHLLGRTLTGQLALQAYLVEGESSSDPSAPSGWRTYLLEHITEAQPLDDTFAAPRPGYRASGGRGFRSVACAL